MRENNRKPIEKCRRKLSQFTTMNVIDGQAGLVIYSSLIFYSLTIDNILNIIVLLILAGITIITLTGNNGILKQATEAKKQTVAGQEIEALNMAVTSLNMEKYSEITEDFDVNYISDDIIKTLGDEDGHCKVDYLFLADGTVCISVKFRKSGNIYYIKPNYEQDKLEILNEDEYEKLINFQVENITDDEKKKLESGTALEINSGSDGALELELTGFIGNEINAIIDWGDGKYSRLGDIYTGKTKIKANKIASTKSVKVGVIVNEFSISHRYTELNKTYSIKIVSDGIYMHSDKLTKIVDWGKCNMKHVWFEGCTNLVEIATPHKESFGTTNLGGCFANCTSLKQVPADFFVNIPYIEDVEGMFYNCTSLTGSAIELWNNNKIKYYDGCYYGCTNLSNYDKIPEDWKKDIKINE